MNLTAEEVVEALVAAYNARDADRFASLFAQDAEVVRHPGEVLQRSRDEVREHYRRSFAEYPSGSTEVVHRVVLGTRVVDHERVRRSPQAPPIDVIAINDVRDGRIVRLDFVSDVPVGG